MNVPSGSQIREIAEQVVARYRDYRVTVQVYQRDGASQQMLFNIHAESTEMAEYLIKDMLKFWLRRGVSYEVMSTDHIEVSFK